jgi:protein-disulfide isomerase
VNREKNCCEGVLGWNGDKTFLDLNFTRHVTKNDVPVKYKTITLYYHPSLTQNRKKKQMILTRSAVRKSGRKLVAPLSNHTQKRRNNNKRSHKVTIDSVKPITAKVGKSNNFYVVEDSVEHLVRLIKDNSNVVVKFFSPHCPHCIAMAVPFMQMA